MACGFIGCVIGPGTPDDAQPGAREDANCVRMIATAGAGRAVDASSPLIGVARVVGQAGNGLAQAMVAGPSKGHAAGLARLVGDRDGAGLSGQLVEGGEALSHVAQFGQDLRGADMAGARKDMMIWPSGIDSTKRSMRRVSLAICSTSGCNTATIERTSWPAASAVSGPAKPAAALSRRASSSAGLRLPL